MSEGSASPKRPRLEFDDSAKDDHHERYKTRDQDDQGSYSNSRKRRGDTDEDDLKDCDDIKSKAVGMDAVRREHTLVMRLTNKEQELQECMNQIQEMKQAQTQNTAQLRSMLLDPAINLVFQRMSKEMDEHKEKLKQKQNELNAWKFTPDSQTGMRLMAKCRMLLQENGELGKIISTGRTAKLEGEISLHKALVGEMKKNQKELDEFVGELEEDVEGMQGMILMLQQQLKEAREQISQLQLENQQLRTLQLPSEPEAEDSRDLPDPISSYSDPTSCCSTTSASHPLRPKPPHSSPLAPSLSIPPADSSESVLTSSSTDFSPDKVTPDSGIQTQEEDDDASANATDSPMVEDVFKVNSKESHMSPQEGESRTKVESSVDVSVRTSTNNSQHSGSDSPCEALRTFAGEDIDSHHSTANPSPPKPSAPARTSPSPSSPIAGLPHSTNGDILVPARNDDHSVDGSVERTHLNEEVNTSPCIDGVGKEELDGLTVSGGEKKGDDHRTCVVTTEQESVVVNSLKSNLTNGSLEDVTSQMDTD